jgi:hypothetical protein
LKLRKSRGSEFLVVKVNQAGRVKLGSKVVKLSRAGTASFKLTAAEVQTLLSKGALAIVYVPKHGAVVHKQFKSH